MYSPTVISYRCGIANAAKAPNSQAVQAVCIFLIKVVELSLVISKKSIRASVIWQGFNRKNPRLAASL